MPTMPTKIKSNKNTYTYAIGRRRSAVASIKLFSGKGDSEVNSTPVKKYFPGTKAEIYLDRPFKAIDQIGKYFYQAKIIGGGKNGQLSALILAISRALKLHDESNRPALRAAGLLTVDSRVRQRRMVGTGGKARRQKQSPKR